MWRGGVYSGPEYYVLENRQQQGYDLYIPDNGLMIYHVDETVGTLALNNLQWSGTHPRVMPMSADNILEFDALVKNYLPKDDTAFPSAKNNTHFGVGTTPNSSDYNGASTNVDVNNISMVSRIVYADLSCLYVSVVFVNPPSKGVIYATRPALTAITSSLDPSSLVVHVQTALNGNYVQVTPTLDETTGNLTCELDLTDPRYQNQTIYVTLLGQDINGGTISHTVQFLLGTKTLTTDIQMISLPVTGIGTAPTVFGTDFISTIARPQMLATWDPITGSYLRYSQSTGADLLGTSNAAIDADTSTAYPPAGRAFWVKLPATTLLALPGDILRQDRTYKVPIKQGFNMVGNPFAYPVDLTSMAVEYNHHLYTMPEAVAAKIVAATIYAWSPTDQGYSFASMPDAVLTPWVGYWLLCRAQTQTVNCNLVFLPVPAGEARSAKAPARPAGEGWAFDLKAVEPLTARKATVTLGALSTATNLDDESLDIAAPPAGPNGLRLMTANGGTLPLMRDYRALLPGGDYQWDVRLVGVPGAQVTLTWPQLSALPKDYVLTLHDQITGEDRYMRTATGYTVTFGAQETERRLTIAAHPGTQGGLRIASLTAQRARTAGGAVIACQVTRDAQVTVEIRTLAGRLVKRYPATAFATGAVTLNWDGTDTQGRRVPRGTYLCQIVAETAAGEKTTAVATLPF